MFILKEIFIAKTVVVDNIIDDVAAAGVFSFSILIDLISLLLLLLLLLESKMYLCCFVKLFVCFLIDKHR